MFKVTIINEVTGDVQVEEHVDGYALSTVQETEDKKSYGCLTCISGEMNLSGYMALRQSVTELTNKTQDALMKATDDALSGMSVGELVRTMGGLGDLLSKLNKERQPDLSDLFGNANDSEQESMRNYFRSRDKNN